MAVTVVWRGGFWKTAEYSEFRGIGELIEFPVCRHNKRFMNKFSSRGTGKECHIELNIHISKTKFAAVKMALWSAG